MEEKKIEEKRDEESRYMQVGGEHASPCAV